MRAASPARVRHEHNVALQNLLRRGGVSRNTCAFHAEVDSIKPGLRRQVQRLAVIVAPSQIVRVHGSNDGAQVLSFGRDHPNSARTGDI